MGRASGSPLRSPGQGHARLMPPLKLSSRGLEAASRGEASRVGVHAGSPSPPTGTSLQDASGRVLVVSGWWVASGSREAVVAHPERKTARQLGSGRAVGWRGGRVRRSGERSWPRRPRARPRWQRGGGPLPSRCPRRAWRGTRPARRREGRGRWWRGRTRSWWSCWSCPLDVGVRRVFTGDQRKTPDTMRGERGEGGRRDACAGPPRPRPRAATARPG